MIQATQWIYNCICLDALIIEGQMSKKKKKKANKVDKVMGNSAFTFLLSG